MYNLTSEEVFNRVKSSKSGLTQNEAKNRLIENGKNKVNLDSKRTFKHKISHELNQIVYFVLLFALTANIVAVVLTRDKLQVINIALIFMIMVLNIVIGIWSSSKMERTLSSIKSNIPATTKVKRGNKVISINSEDLVVGDIVYLEEGDIVPADIRLIDTNNLKIEDTIITGQKMATEKHCDVIDGKYMPLGDRHNMVYMGSSVAVGSGVGVVVATGKNTELGKTEKLLSENINLETPFIARLNQFICGLSYIVLVLSLISFVINTIRGGDVADSFMVAVSLAVCVVPESLLISIYSTLALGVKRLGKNNLLVKDLSSVENLGDIDVLCVDKTKVLTLNQKQVTDIWVSDMENYEPRDNPNFSSIINCMVLASSATLELEENELSIKGCNTEKALLNYALEMGFSKDGVEGIFPQVNIFPFDRYRKMMSTLNSVGKETYAFTKGDFERVFEKCTTLLVDGKSRLMTETDKNYIYSMFDNWKRKGNEVMGFATKLVSGNIYELNASDVENNMTFVGLCAIADPEKPDTSKTLKEFNKLGIKVVMLTSDEKENAYLVAKNMGICKSEKQVITGYEIDLMTDVELCEKIYKYTVFSKLLSGQKLRIVKALQQQDKIVAVTGDNAEDIPAISQADVGIGLAKSGCEVIKQTSHILTNDDSLNSIKEGVITSRKIQFNIRKMVEYLLTASVSQVLLITLIVLVLGKPLFSPALILWLNFINGLIPCFALGSERPNFDISKKPDCNVIFGKTTFKNIFTYGILQALVIAFMYLACESNFLDSDVTVTMCFVTLAFMQIFHAYNLKNYDKSVFASNPFNNGALNIGFLVSLVATILFVSIPVSGIHLALNTTHLTINEWLICLGAGATIIVLSEMVKLIKEIIKNKR